MKAITTNRARYYSRKRASQKSEQVSITLPHQLIKDIDELALDVGGISRSEVIKDILNKVIYDDDHLNEIYPFEEEREEIVNQVVKASVADDLEPDPKQYKESAKDAPQDVMKAYQ